MISSDEGITIDTKNQRTCSFWRRQLADAMMMHLVDGLVLFLAMLLGDCILYWWNDIPVQMAPVLLLIPAWWIGTWMAHLVPGWGLGVVEEFRRIELLLIILFSAALVAVFFQRDFNGSRISFFAAYLIATTLVPLGRGLTKHILGKLNLWGVPTVIYGDKDSVPKVVKMLKKDHSFGFIPDVVLSNDYQQGEIIGGLPVLGGLYNTTRRIPVAVVALPKMPRHDLINLLEGPLQTYNTILLIPDLYDAPSLWVKPCDVQGILALEIRRNLLDPVASLFKNVAERSLVLLTLPLWGPLCLFLMLLIWLHDFKFPLYVQKRIGKNNLHFKMYKLRTMVSNAEMVLPEKLAQNPKLKTEWDRHHKLKKDPRITWIGKLLRETSLDEIPQLWCVLIGTMALVGPRPLPKYHHKKLNARTQRLRVRVRPGITGLWQVSGRSEAGTAGMNKWDIYYVTNWSIWLDIVILVRTVKAVLCGGGAY